MALQLVIHLQKIYFRRMMLSQMEFVCTVKQDTENPNPNRAISHIPQLYIRYRCRQSDLHVHAFLYPLSRPFQYGRRDAFFFNATLVFRKTKISKVQKMMLRGSNRLHDTTGPQLNGGGEYTARNNQHTLGGLLLLKLPTLFFSFPAPPPTSLFFLLRHSSSHA